MPTILSHPVPMIALGLGLGPRRIPPRLLLAMVVFSILPDVDVLFYKFGFWFNLLYVHRGQTHSLGFSLVCGLFGGLLLAPNLKAGRIISFFMITLAVFSHDILDAATSGGDGVMAWWPLSEKWFFLPWRPIRVSPLNIKAFLSGQGRLVLISEFWTIWLPFMVLTLLLKELFSRNKKNKLKFNKRLKKI